MPSEEAQRIRRRLIHRSAWKKGLFSEDEMRRPTPLYAVPLMDLQMFDGLLGPIWKEDQPTMDGSKERPKVTAGLDIGDKYS